jgi:hypothetical protein
MLHTPKYFFRSEHSATDFSPKKTRSLPERETATSFLAWQHKNRIASTSNK